MWAAHPDLEKNDSDQAANQKDCFRSKNKKITFINVTELAGPAGCPIGSDLSIIKPATILYIIAGSCYFSSMSKNDDEGKIPVVLEISCK